jgi:hypothetical protein
VPQQIVTYQDVPRTEYRQEAYLETIPRTVYENVTVDEGGYQTVWVPKPVTRSVARTVYQQQLSYRTVPYQTTQRVAQTSTRFVPQQTVGYVPYSYQTASSCRACGTLPSQLGPLPAAVSPGLPSVGTVAPAVPTVPAITVPLPTPQNLEKSLVQPGEKPEPIPDPKFSGAMRDGMDQEWTVVQSRRTTHDTSRESDRLGGYDVAGPTPVRSEPQQRAVRRIADGRFVPAPSAATVWQSQTSFR